MNQARNYLSAASLAIGICTLSACTLTPDSSPPLSAQRTTLSSDTSTATPGTVEVEAGYHRDPHETWQIPANVKYGFGPKTEGFAGAPVHLQLHNATEEVEGFGDVSLGVRHRFWEDTDLGRSAAVQFVWKLPTADDHNGLGTGEPDASLSGIYSHAIGDALATLFVGVDRIGLPDQSHARGEHQALALALPMWGRFGSFVEWSRVDADDGLGALQFATAGLTYDVGNHWIWDFGVIEGLESEQGHQVFVGFTHNLGRIGSRD